MLRYYFSKFPLTCIPVDTQLPKDGTKRVSDGEKEVRLWASLSLLPALSFCFALVFSRGRRLSFPELA